MLKAIDTLLLKLIKGAIGQGKMQLFQRLNLAEQSKEGVERCVGHLFRFNLIPVSCLKSTFENTTKKSLQSKVPIRNSRLLHTRKKAGLSRLEGRANEYGTERRCRCSSWATEFAEAGGMSLIQGVAYTLRSSSCGNRACMFLKTLSYMLQKNSRAFRFLHFQAMAGELDAETPA